MTVAALVLGLAGALVLGLPFGLGVPLEIATPFTAPIGGGLSVMALVLAGTVILSRERKKRAPRLARVAVGLAIAGVVVALATEISLIRRARATKAQNAAKAADKKSTADKAREDQQFDNDLNDNLAK